MLFWKLHFETTEKLTINASTLSNLLEIKHEDESSKIYKLYVRSLELINRDLF